MQILHQSTNQNAQVLPKQQIDPDLEEVTEICAEMRQEGARATRKRSSSAKNRLAYWKERIFLPTYQRNGETITSPNYAIELQYRGERVRWSLGPALNRSIAAQRAQAIYFFLHANGWEATRAKFRPASLAQADPAIGTFIDQVEKTADLRPKTRAAYVNALKKIVSDAFGFSHGSAKFGHGRGHREWLEKVYSVRLSQLTPELIQTWKRSFLAAADQDPLSQRSARVSVNSFLRCAKSLFSANVVKHLGLEMPSPLPFASVTFEPKANTKYRSEFAITELIASAQDELALPEPEVFKIFALGTFAGLRRKEIDLLPWTAFRWDEGVIRIEATQHFSAKSEDSYSDVPLDREVLELFRGYRAQATGEFVIESPEPPRPEATYDYYRCEAAFQRLITWLRSHGVRSKKPLHALRKEFGSQLCAAHGIYAASRALRHSSIAISAAFYTDSKARASVGLGHLLESPKVVEVEFRQEVA